MSLDPVHIRISSARGKAVPETPRTVEIDIEGGESWLAH